MVDILMATYNGGRYLAQQLDSILAQSFPDWNLLIRDDGSTDGTLRLCGSYAAKNPSRIRVLTDNLGRLGPRGNFSELLSQSRGEHAMFCDQDDVWLPHKVEISLAAMQDIESKHGEISPALVHTDSRVVNEDLQLISPSLLKYLHRKPSASLNRLCMELPVYGHSVMINAALRELGWPIPEGFVSWDWWYPLVATAFGRVRFVDEATVLFRRHQRTSSTTRKHGLSAFLSNSFSDYRRKVHISLRQGEIFFDRFSLRLNADQRRFFTAVCEIRHAHWVRRRYLILRHRLFKTGLLKTLGVLIAV